MIYCVAVVISYWKPDVSYGLKPISGGMNPLAGEAAN